jgi:hypothetical protein
LKEPQAQYPPIRKQNGNWARSQEEKAEIFAMHLSKVFKPNPREITLEKENTLLSDDITSIILDTTTRPFIIKEMGAIIENLNPRLWRVTIS